MAGLKSIGFGEDKTISLLFGSKWYRDAQTKTGFKSFDEVTERILKFDIDFIVELISCAHESACFFKHTETTYKHDDYYDIVDAIGLREVNKLVSEAYLDLSGYSRLTEAEKEKLNEEVKKNTAK
jgi:hypothetical protein